MCRRLLNFTAAVSLVMCVATVVAWVVASRWAVEVSHYSQSGTVIWHCNDCSAVLCGASLYLRTEAFDVTTTNAQQDYAQAVEKLNGWTFHIWPQPAVDNSFWNSFWINPTVYPTSTQFNIRSREECNVPYRFILPATSLLPIFWIGMKLAHRRRAILRARRNVCAGCGYSLTGNTSGVCPECGSPVADKAEAKA